MLGSLHVALVSPLVVYVVKICDFVRFGFITGLCG